MLNIKKVEYSYNRKEKTIKDISHNFSASEITSILGPNGSGKTTLLKVLMRLLKNPKNEMTINDKNITFFKTKEFARKVAYVPQTISFPDATSVRDFVAYGRHPYSGHIGLLSKEDWKKVDEALILCDILHLREKEVKNLSGGQKQIVAIALTIAQDSDIILLDEPNSFLDVSYVSLVMNLLIKLKNEFKKTIIMTIHDINQAAKFSDEIILMKNGKIIYSGLVKDTITKDNLRKTFEINAEIITINKKPHIVDYEQIK